MATDDINVVDPDNGSGTNYTSLNLWEDGEDGDLVSADIVAIAKCRSTGGTADTTAVTIDGWTTDATRYIKIWTDPAEAYRHSGTRNSAKYRITNSSHFTHTISIQEAYTKLDGIQVKTTGADSSAVYVNAASCSISNCLAYDCQFAGWIGNGYNIRHNATLINCISVNCLTNGFTVSVNSTTVNFYNCVAANNGGSGIISSGGYSTINIKNCYSGGNTGDDYSKNALDTINFTTSLSEDGSLSTTTAAFATGSGCKFANVTAGSEDLHVSSGSSLIGAGTNLYADFTTDIDGDTRPSSGAWCIGVDEVVAAAKAVFQYLFKNRFRHMAIR